MKGREGAVSMWRARICEKGYYVPNSCSVIYLYRCIFEIQAYEYERREGAVSMWRARICNKRILYTQPMWYDIFT